LASSGSDFNAFDAWVATEDDILRVEAELSVRLPGRSGRGSRWSQSKGKPDRLHRSVSGWGRWPLEIRHFRWRLWRRGRFLQLGDRGYFQRGFWISG